MLFRIEDQTYRAEVTSASAEVDLAQASVDTAQETVDRYQRLLGTGVTQEELASARVIRRTTRRVTTLGAPKAERL